MTLRHKKRRTAKRKATQTIRTGPPLSTQSEAAFYLEEEARGVYDDFWQNMGYYVEHGVDYPPHTSSKGKHPNNRAPGWSGIFTFTFFWKEVGQQEQQELLHTLIDEYQCEIAQGEGDSSWTASLRTTGKRVKTLTRMLNRQYAKKRLVWKEL